MSSIQSLPPFPKVHGLDTHSNATSAREGKFAEKLNDFIHEYNIEAKVAQSNAAKLATGQPSDMSMSETILALQKADLSFQLMLSVRNKLVDAYREVMRMQV